MKVILLKPNEKPKVVELPKKHTYLDIKRLLEIESPLTCVSRQIGNKYYDFWCDDEGLYPEKKYISACCYNASEILCGNVMIAQNDGKGEIVGLTKTDIEKILDTQNLICNKEYLDFCVWHEKIIHPKNEDGDSMVIKNYQGFGPLFLKDGGYMLRYSI